MRGADGPRERGEDRERDGGGDPEARDGRPLAQRPEELARGLLLAGLEDERRDGHRGRDAEGHGEEDAEIGDDEASERRRDRRAALDDRGADGPCLEQCDEQRRRYGAPEGEHETEQRAEHGRSSTTGQPFGRDFASGWAES